MTNGEMIQKVFNCEVCEPIIEDDIIHVIFADKKDSAIGLDWSWWNAEYKEPTTKNDLPHCQHTDEEIAKSFIEDIETVKDQLPCGEQMDFPSTFDEFAKDYGFKDKDEIYTNGSELIPVFRVKQWLEHISTTKNDLSSGLEKNSKKLEKDFGELDCISRAGVIKILGKIEQMVWDGEGFDYEESRAMIDELPSVTPQEPRKGHWEHGKELSKEYRGRILVNVTYADWHCSNCNYVIKGTVKPKWNYCPNCGAKMIEPQESEDI